MEPQQNNVQNEAIVSKESWYAPLTKVTLVSKILAAVVFITLPFAGFFVGGMYTVEKNDVTVLPEIKMIKDQANAPKIQEQKNGASIEEGSDQKEEGIATTTVTAYVKSIDKENVVLDYIDIYMGDEAYRMAILDGKCSNPVDCGKEVSPSIYDRNVNGKLRTLKLAQEVQINSWMNTKMSIDEMANIVKQGSFYPQEVTLNSNDEVVKLQSIFRP